MKKQYFIIVLLVLVGLAASVYLLPGAREMALMNFRAKKFDEAKVIYQKQINEHGMPPVTDIGPIVDLLLQDGKIEDAIKVLENYLKDHPNDVEARRRLGTYYQYAQRPEDYLRNLEILNKMAPAPDNYKKLSDIYNFNVQYDKQINVLREMIIKKQGASAQTYDDLANLLASQRHAKESIDVLRSKKQAYPKEFRFEQEELLVSLLMDEKMGKDAQAEAKEWAAQSKNPTQIARLANIIHYKGEPKLALELITPYLALTKDSPDLLNEQVFLYLDNGMENEAYKIMGELYAQKKLTGALYGAYIDTAIKRGDIKTVYELANSIDREDLTESQASYMIESAVSNHEDELLKLLTNKFNDAEYLKERPVLDAVLSLANHKGDADAKVAHAEQAMTLNNGHRLTLARACARAAKRDCTRHFMDKLLEDPNLNERETVALGELYLINGDIDEGYTYIAKQREEFHSAGMENLWVKLSAARGEEKPVFDWMAKEAETANDQMLRDVFFLSADHRHFGIATKMAEFMFKRDQNPQTKEYLANAYVKAGRYADALPYLRELRDKSERQEMDYVQVLGKLAPKNAEYRKELTDYVGKRLETGKLSDKYKQAMIYTLINAGASDLAMPYVKNYALAQGGSWGALYESQLRKKGQKRELYEYRMARLQKKNVPASERRGIGYGLLEEGYRQDAEAVFGRLVTSAGPNSPDTKQLLYLWGPRISDEQADWLEMRYNRAPMNSRPGWLKALADTGNGERVARLVEANPDNLSNPQIQELYINALAETGQSEKLDAQIKDILPRTQSPEAVRKLAHLAEGNYLTQTARTAYEKLADLRPDDLEATRSIGIIAHTQADYTNARHYLTRYIELAGDKKPDNALEDAKARFYYAELLRRDKRFADAATNYAYASQVMDALPEKTMESRSMSARAKYFQGNLDGSFDEFEGILAEHPNDKIMAADYVDVLLEAKYYGTAQKVTRAALTQDTGYSPVVHADMTPLVLSTSIVRAHKVENDGRDVVMEINGSADRVRALADLSRRKPAWLGYINSGYDQVVVSAANNYVLDVTEADGKVIVQPRESASQLKGRLYEQAMLRLHLLNARIDLETGHAYRAVSNLNDLRDRPEYDKDPQLLGFSANAENFAGRWRRALSMLDEAGKLAPENEDIKALDKAIQREHAQFAKIGYDWRHINQHNEHIVSAEGFAYVKPFTRLGFDFDNDFVQAENIQRADGRIGDFNATRQRGEIYLGYDAMNGVSTKGSVFFNNDTFGGGIYLGFISPIGQSQIYGELRRPNWEFVEGVLDNANRDRVGIKNEYKVGQNFVLQGDLAYNRYNVDFMNDVDRSISFAGSAIYKFYDRNSLLMWLGYGIDAEYRKDHTQLTDPLTGNLYSPFPLLTREVHSLNWISRYNFSERTYFDGLLGYGWDRFGGNGPNVEARITHELTPSVDAEAHASYGKRFKEGEGNVGQVGGSVLWRF